MSWDDNLEADDKVTDQVVVPDKVLEDEIKELGSQITAKYEGAENFIQGDCINHSKNTNYGHYIHS